MLKVRQAILGVAAAAAIALVPMESAMAGGHGFRPLHPFGFGRGIVGAAVALVALPLVIASNVLASVGESVAPPYPTPGYAGPEYGYAPPVAYAEPRPYYYAPHPGYYAAPRAAYGRRAYYGAHPGYDGRGYYRSGGNSYPRR